MVAAKKAKHSVDPPVSLTNIQVDVTTRLGAVAEATTTGLSSFDEMLGGGLRSGMHVAVFGGPGVGKTAFALMLGYMAARAKAAVLFASVGLDDTEVMARLTARALHREYENVDATYGTIWSGEAMQDAALRGPIGQCINGVVKKVGSLLHLYSARPMEETTAISARALQLLGRHERVVVVVDGIEGLSASDGEKAAWASATYDGRISQVAYELMQLSDDCAVVTTCQAEHAHLLMPATTFAAELRAVRDPMPRRRGPPRRAVGTKPVDLLVVKNRRGPTGAVPLSYFAAASVFEQRGP